MSKGTRPTVPGHTHSADDLSVGMGKGMLAQAPEALQRRIRLADMPSATVASISFGEIPPNRVVQSAQVYITTSPTGGGASSCTLTVSGTSVLGGPAYINAVELLDFSPSNNYLQPANAAPGTFGVGDVSRGLRAGWATLISDVNLDDLTALDITVYVILSPAELVPPS